MDSDDMLAAEGLLALRPEIKAICKPLLTATPIAHVGYWGFDAQGDYIALSPNSGMEDFLGRGLYKVGRQMGSFIKHSGFSRPDRNPAHAEARRELDELGDRWGWGAPLMYVVDAAHTETGDCAAFCFKCHADDPEGEAFLLNNSLVLKSFARYFLRKFSDLGRSLARFPGAEPPARDLPSPELDLPRFLSAHCSKTQLSPKQLEIVDWYLAGKTTEETAAIMGVSVNTVHMQFARLKRKLDCRTKAQVLRELLNDGLGL